MPPLNLGQLLVQIQYPGMTWVESQIAKAWINRHGAEYDAIDFNVRIGEGVDPGEEYTAEVRRMATLLSQKRADITARVGDLHTLIEVKIRIGFPVIGQLIGYRELYKRIHPEASEIKLLTIGRDVVPDAADIIQDQGIAIELFPRES